MTVIDLEKMVIGAIILENESYDKVSDVLEPKLFTDERNKRLFECISELFVERQNIDLVAIYEKLNNKKLTNEIDYAYLSELTDNIFSSANIKKHSYLLYDKWVSREIIRYSQQTIYDAESEDPYKLIEQMLNKLESLNNHLEIEEDYNLGEKIPEVFEDLVSRRNNENEQILKSKYIPSFNKMTSGLMYGNLLSIQGKDKAGKTTLSKALTLDFAINMNIPVVIFSLEMGKMELAWKAIGLETGIPYSKMRNPKGFDRETYFTDNEIKDAAEKAYNRFKDSKIFVIDKLMNEFQIYATFKRLKRQYGVVFGLIDYIGLIESSKEYKQRDQTINYLSRFFKKMARDLNVIPCVLSQQNRDGGIAEGKGLERDSDYSFEVINPYSDGLDKIKVNGKEYDVQKGDFFVRLKKSRHTEQGSAILCRYVENTFREVDLEQEIDTRQMEVNEKWKD